VEVVVVAVRCYGLSYPWHPTTEALATNSSASVAERGMEERKEEGKEGEKKREKGEKEQSAKSAMSNGCLKMITRFAIRPFFVTFFLNWNMV
jgi:hypothetical protein